MSLTGAVLSALGEEGSLILHAGKNLTMDTDTLEAKTDMTENSDNYMRTYRKTETTNTLAAGKTITRAAGENLSARNTTVLSENGQITVAAKGDVNLENGYNESKDDYGLKYKERGLLSSKTTTIKSRDESKNVTAFGGISAGKSFGVIEAVGGAMAGDRAKDWSKDKIPTDQDIQLTKGSSKGK